MMAATGGTNSRVKQCLDAMIGVRDPALLVAVAKAYLAYRDDPAAMSVQHRLYKAAFVYEASQAVDKTSTGEGLDTLGEISEMARRIAQIQDVPMGKPSNFEERIAALEELYRGVTNAVGKLYHVNPLTAAKDAVIAYADGYEARYGNDKSEDCFHVGICTSIRRLHRIEGRDDFVRRQSHLRTLEQGGKT